MLKYGWTALHRAALNGSEQIVKILVEHGSNVHLQTSVLIIFLFLFLFFLLSLFVVVVHSLLFHVDCEWLCCVIFILFLFFFNNFFLLLKNGKTALHFAASRGFEQIVEILIEHGSNVNLQDKVFILI